MIFNNSNIDDIELLYNSISESGATLLIDKPLDWTSFNVVAKIRNTLKIKKIGHAGTLDPLASGLLIICLGRHTKIISQYQDMRKVYTGKVKLGATTKSFDSEFEEENICDISYITNEDVQIAAKSFIGEQLQIPPMFSAKKVAGKRLYQLARKDIEIELSGNSVNFYDVRVNYSAPYIDFYIECSKGTYIRSFARDIGEKLAVGAYLSELRRTAIGEYSIENAIELPKLITLINDYKMDLVR